jgi:hypothetical protein|tara:strand:- start:1247 stop:1486 length:240 start_codon:yes stop_codon:yes gene_type:complete
MESSILIYFSVALSVIFLLIGGVVGWLWNDKTNQFLYTQAEEEVDYVHPEMLDENGQWINSQLLSVRFSEIETEEFEEE